MTCTVAKRERARKCADTLAARESVLAVDVLDPHTDPTDRWTLDIVLCTEGVPPVALDDLGNYQATLRSVARQGTHWQAVAVL